MDPNLVIFAQIACAPSETALASKKNLGLAVSLIGIFMVLAF